MRRSHTITLQIDYAYDLAYRFLMEPRNFADWAAVDKESYRPLDNGDWAGDLPFGFRHFRFTPANDFGVLDHAIFVPGETPFYTSMRLMPNEAGTELVFTVYQRPGTEDALFASGVEWLRTDLLALKSLLEARAQ
ncbi:hypothetical protein VW29_17250 [Devosia limi DSM 17137]|uniref:Polyketide cyclase n=1 Tax=Devosia limi DSM 17137 TaxID=1121477 RepID=A0A0F5LE62_9HYPH|nr:hypothetical protein [Devosia limi]KKB80550.1 hypothetical protein VW29_17250 [Devosia limi DSM 17137]SHE41574.1 hypothetical protein SAMN02745223_00321 [Devosia limi DSM 17137]